MEHPHSTPPKKTPISFSHHPQFLHTLWPPRLLICLLALDLPLLDALYKWNHAPCGLRVWLLSLSITFSRLMRVTAGVDAVPILWLNHSPLSGWTTCALSFTPKSNAIHHLRLPLEVEAFNRLHSPKLFVPDVVCPVPLSSRWRERFLVPLTAHPPRILYSIF